jgi:transcriptional regulator of acetoin/glycerol metabolism
LSLDDALALAEKQILLQSLETFNWNRQRCAQNLGISRTTLFNKMRRFHLVDPRRRNSASSEQ